MKGQLIDPVFPEPAQRQPDLAFNQPASIVGNSNTQTLGGRLAGDFNNVFCMKLEGMYQFGKLPIWMYPPSRSPRVLAITSRASR
jgi:hypothetical protein